LPARLVINANQEAEIIADVSFSKCKGSSKSQVNFSWSQAATNDGNKAPILSDFSFDQITSSILHIPAHVFEAGSAYCLVLSISLSEGAVKTTQASYDFTVGVLPLVAYIEGGNTISFGYSSGLVLDGSQSVDPNIAPTVNQGLTFSWSCILDDGFTSQKCSNEAGTLIELGSGSKLVLPPFTLSPSSSPDVLYKFILQVSKPGRCKLLHALIRLPCLCQHHHVLLVCLQLDAICFQFCCWE
jgi:hypothetical protein